MNQAVDGRIKSGNSRLLRRICSWACALCASFTVSMTFANPVPEHHPEGFGSGLKNIFEILNGSITNPMALSILFFAFCLMARKLRPYRQDSIGYRVLALVTATVCLLGKSYEVDNTRNSIAGAPGQAVKSVIVFIGVFFLLQILAAFLFWIKDRLSEWDRSLKEKPLYDRFLQRPFLWSFITLMAAGTPHIILSYPAAMCVDTWNQLGQFMGFQTFTSHHPPFHTLFLGGLFKAGYLASGGNGNVGLFLTVCVQFLIMLLIMAVMISRIALKSPLIGLTASIAVIFCPYYFGYMPVILKDNMYSIMVLLLFLETLMLMEKIGTGEEEDFCHSHRTLLLLALAIMGTWLFRNNGKYLLIPFLGVLAIHICRNVMGRSRRILLVCLILPLLLSFGADKGIAGIYHIQPGSIREALSLPFQQTARYVKYHSDTISREDKQVIDKILDYDSLAENYDPRISDPVKNTFRNTCTTSDLLNYIKVWGRCLLRDPLCYMDATLNQNYYLLYPFSDNVMNYTNTINEKRNIEVEYANKLNIREIPVIEKGDQARGQYLNLLYKIPGVNFATNIAICNLIVLVILADALKRRRIITVIASLPILLSDVIIVLAPVISRSPRYAFPVVFCTIPLLCFWLKDTVE